MAELASQAVDYGDDVNLSSKHAKQMAEVSNILSAYRVQKVEIEEEHRRRWAEREKLLLSEKGRVLNGRKLGCEGNGEWRRRKKRN